MQSNLGSNLTKAALIVLAAAVVLRLLLVVLLSVGPIWSLFRAYAGRELDEEEAAGWIDIEGPHIMTHTTLTEGPAGVPQAPP